MSEGIKTVEALIQRKDEMPKFYFDQQMNSLQLEFMKEALDKMQEILNSEDSSMQSKHVARAFLEKWRPGK